MIFKDSYDILGAYFISYLIGHGESFLMCFFFLKTRYYTLDIFIVQLPYIKETLFFYGIWAIV